MNTFTKQERLTNKNQIEQLTQSSNSYILSPLKIIWLQTEKQKVPVQIVITVPKRIFKKAFHRNHIKRLIRECYRKNKSILIDGLQEKNILLMIIYNSKTIIEYKEMEKITVEILKTILKKINDKN